MASQVLASVADVWPAGTSVGAYVRPAGPAWDRMSVPSTVLVATAVVAADGSLSFTGLADDTAYVAYALGRARDFRTTPVSSGTSGGTVTTGTAVPTDVTDGSIYVQLDASSVPVGLYVAPGGFAGQVIVSTAAPGGIPPNSLYLQTDAAGAVQALYAGASS